nr:hypothetical protein CFP56_58432 [Quercus suber]
MGESSNSTYDKNGASSSDSGRAAGKRKAPISQQSNPNKPTDGKSIFKKENCASNRQKQLGHVHLRKKNMCPASENGVANSSPIKKNGPALLPDGFSQVPRSLSKPATRSKVREEKIRSVSKHGGSRKMGVVLQRQNSPNRGRNNQVDQARPNENLGVVRLGADAGMEEYFSVDGEKQKAGVSAVVEHSMGVDTKSVVEVCDGQTSNAAPSTSKLNLVKGKFRGVTLGKIADRVRKGGDDNGEFREEDA